jgi:hypothetical protein
MRSCCFKRAGQLMGAALVSGLLWTATAIPASAQDVLADHIKECLLFIASEPPEPQPPSHGTFGRLSCAYTSLLRPVCRAQFSACSKHSRSCSLRLFSTTQSPHVKGGSIGRY